MYFVLTLGKDGATRRLGDGKTQSQNGQENSEPGESYKIRFHNQGDIVIMRQYTTFDMLSCQVENHSNKVD